MATAGGSSNPIGALAGFGLAAVVVVPIIYGAFGFVGGLIGAVIYNVVAGIAGGIEVDVA
jgi:hypothetical protein